MSFSRVRAAAILRIHSAVVCHVFSRCSLAEKKLSDKQAEELVRLINEHRGD